MMARITKQALRYAEDLSLPTVQVVVMRANLSCKHCQQRASDMVSKMNGLLDYVVDVPNKEVVMRGVVNLKKRKSYRKIPSQTNNRKKKFTCLSAFHGFKCFGS